MRGSRYLRKGSYLLQQPVQNITASIKHYSQFILLKGLSFLCLTQAPAWAQGSYRNVVLQVGLCEG